MAVSLLVGEVGLNAGNTEGLEVGAVQYNNNYMNESLEANISEIGKYNGYVNTVWTNMKLQKEYCKNVHRIHWYK